jgi:cell division protein FtsI/penicillin-binding protein 2
VQSVHKQDGSLVYAAEPKISGTTVDAATASEIRALMRETVRRGTSRRSFSGFQKGPMRFVQVGGKTGSLTGDDPKGKYDWFVGYAENGSQRIAVAALTVHRKYWKVKSSYLARKAFERHFKDQLRTVASVR